ncbi:MAG: heme biosynthesis HemY N-terminal domain-containing protein [Pseudobdellovibrionaceae bacterium]|jgi:HemY protein|nr:heme biosynthesis HemY N-terminal domain-containing protein [Pseudobdellovibrionaceae bacterium]
MIRTIWYLLKVCLILGVATYLATLPGEVQLGWADYHVTVQMGFLAVSAFIGFLVLVFVSGLAYRIFSFPSAFLRYRSQKRHAEGYKALLRSLTAAATGDHKNANYLAFRAQKLLPADEQGLPLLLQAQAMREMGKFSNVDEPYQLLLKNAETSLLGLQGLVQNAILASDFPKALSLAREAVKKYPKNYALLKTVYDLEIRMTIWNDALVTLDQAVKRKVIDKAAAQSDRIAIYCALGDMAKEEGRGEEALAFYRRAVDLDFTFVPAVMRLAQLFLDRDERKRAEAVLLKAWKRVVHPDLISMLAKTMPLRKSGAVSPKFKWVEGFAKYHPEAFCSYIELAKAAIEESLWGDARMMLSKAEKVRIDKQVYELWVTLEEKTTNRPDAIRQWMDRSYASERTAFWVCSRTHRKFSSWAPIVQPEGYFNTLHWEIVLPEVHGELKALAAE